MTELRASTSSMELILVRHAASTRANVGIWGRLYDAPLERGFELQLAGTKSALQFRDESRIVSSPLLRCRETAAFIFPKRNIEIVDEFRAYHSGILENATEKFVREHHPEYLRLSYRDRFLRPKFNEESIEVQARRVTRGLHKVLVDGGRSTVIVAHYSSLNIIAHIASRNWNLETHADGTYDVGVGAYIRLVIDPASVINDVQDQLGWQ